MIQNTPRTPNTAERLETVDADPLSAEPCFTFDDRHWLARGLAANTSFDRLKVVLRVERDGLLHIDTVDLYVARQRSAFIRRVADELYVDADLIRQDLGQVLRTLETAQQRQIHQTLDDSAESVAPMTDQQQQQALALLQAPHLSDRILGDLDQCGLVGERTNKLLVYLAATSRQLARPLAIMVQSSSAAGKTSLVDRVLDFLPPEDVVRCSALTGQALFYMDRDALKHKALAVAEQAGADSAGYALKLLQSDGRLSIVTTERSSKTGRTAAQHYQVEGPTALLLTTTALEVDEELANRCIVLSVDEDRSQTQAIHRRQRWEHLAAGPARHDHSQACRQLHQNAQRLLEPLAVINPYADQLTFPDTRPCYRRAHQHYLTLIDAITLLYQKQRTVREHEVDGTLVRSVVTALEDIALANRLVHALWGRCVEELPPQTGTLLRLVEALVDQRAVAEAARPKEVRFTRRQVREFTHWGQTQLQMHLRRLEQMEYLIVHRSGPGRRIAYELAYLRSAAGDAKQLSGLVNVSQLKPPESSTQLP